MPPRQTRKIVAVGLLTFVVTLITFLRAVGGGMVYDDWPVLVHNRALALPWGQFVPWALGSDLGGHFQPLSWLSLRLDYALGGLDPQVYHFTSVLVHASVVVALFWAVWELARTWRPQEQGHLLVAATAALLFGLHPLRVESVAWITERRDVLSGLFYALGMALYVRGLRVGGTRLRVYAVLLFTISAFCKAWVISLPVAILAVDLLLRRDETLGWRRLLVEKIPFVLIGALAGITALAAVQTTPVFLGSAQHGLVARGLQACGAVIQYLRTTFWPSDLCALYELRFAKELAPPAWLNVTLVLLLTAVTLLLWRRTRWPLVGWLFLVAVYSPSSGIAQSGPQLAADRYTYIALWPVAVIVAYGLRALVYRSTSRWARASWLALAAGLLLTLAATTYRQIAFWKDDVALWTRVLEINPLSDYALTSRGVEHLRAGRLALAERDLERAQALGGRSQRQWHGLGKLRMSQRRFGEALPFLRTSLRIEGKDAPTWVLYAEALRQVGRTQHSLAACQRAVALDKKLLDARVLRGLLHAELGHSKAARADFAYVLQHAPASWPRAAVVRGWLQKLR